jgi:hypothetical protein
MLNGWHVGPPPRIQQNAERSAERHGSRGPIRHAKHLPFNPIGSGHPRALSIAPERSEGKQMLQSEQAWTGQFYSRREFNAREGGEDFVSAMQQMEPDIFDQADWGRSPTSMAVTKAQDCHLYNKQGVRAATREQS